MKTKILRLLLFGIFLVGINQTLLGQAPAMRTLLKHAKKVPIIFSDIPQIVDFYPKTAAANDFITIVGINLDKMKTITVGGQAANSFNIVSPAIVVVRIPSGASNGNIAITTKYGSS